MRRTSGIRVGTIAILAVLLVALSVGAGAFAFPSAVAVRTAGAHSESARTLAAPHSALATHAPSPAVLRPVAGHAHPGAINATNNTTLTSIAITPINTTIAPGASLVLSATLTCMSNNTANATVVACPANLTANVSYAWSVGTPFAGSLNESNQSTVTFTANWATSSTTVGLTGALSDFPTYNNSTVNAAPATINVATSEAPAITITYTTAFQVYMHVPWWLNFTVSVTGGSVAPTSTWVYVNVRDLIPTCGSQYSFLGAPPCPEVFNVSLPVSSGQSTFSYLVNYTNLDQAGYANPTAGVFPADVYQFIAWVTDNNSAANQTAANEQNAYLVFHNPSGVFASPVPGDSLSTGNVSFAVTYFGDYIQAAELIVKNATGQIVFVQGVFAAGQGNRTVVAPTEWLAVTPGQYTAYINFTTPYGTYVSSQSYTVIPAGQTIYINQTAYHNASLLGGLSQGISGMLLLVIGLIIGLVVALVLGRMMWGTPSQPSSPQPWSPTQSGDSSSSSGGTSSMPPSTGSSDMSSEGSTTDK
jgi:hypothetical protein